MHQAANLAACVAATACQNANAALRAATSLAASCTAAAAAALAAAAGVDEEAGVRLDCSALHTFVSAAFTFAATASLKLTPDFAADAGALSAGCVLAAAAVAT